MTDTVTQRFVFNACNRVSKRVLRFELTGNWTYNSTIWRPWNNSSLNRIEIVDGIGTEILDLSFSSRAICPVGALAQYALAVDSVSSITDSYFVSPGDHFLSNRFSRSLGLGYHYCQAMEAIAGSGTVNFYSGGAFGLQGTWQC
jgi:hypothetical protein